MYLVLFHECLVLVVLWVWLLGTHVVYFGRLGGCSGGTTRVAVIGVGSGTYLYGVTTAGLERVGACWLGAAFVDFSWGQGWPLISKSGFFARRMGSSSSSMRSSESRI